MTRSTTVAAVFGLFAVALAAYGLSTDLTPGTSTPAVVASQLDKADGLDKEDTLGVGRLRGPPFLNRRGSGDLRWDCVLGGAP